MVSFTIDFRGLYLPEQMPLFIIFNIIIVRVKPSYIRNMDRLPAGGHLSSLEAEIIKKAEREHFMDFNETKIDSNFKTLMTMKSQINSLLHSKARSDEEMAILIKRFSYISKRLLDSIPLHLQTQLKSKMEFLKSQILDAE
jgi:hypothetical protein